MKRTIVINDVKISFNEIPFKTILKPKSYSLEHKKEFIEKYIDISLDEYETLENMYPGIGEQIIHIFYSKNSINELHTFKDAIQEFGNYYNRLAWIFIKHLYSTGKYQYQELIEKTEKELFFLNTVAMQEGEIVFKDREGFNQYQQLLESLFPKETVDNYLNLANPQIGNLRYNTTAEEIDDTNLKELQNLG